MLLRPHADTIFLFEAEMAAVAATRGWKAVLKNLDERNQYFKFKYWPGIALCLSKKQKFRLESMMSKELEMAKAVCDAENREFNERMKQHAATSNIQRRVLKNKKVDA